MAEETAENETYAAMFVEYVKDNAIWINNVANKPLVFHVKKLCAQLDRQLKAGTDTQAAKDSAYLQAVERLNRRRPGSAGDPPPTGDGARQGSIFDELD